MAAAAEGVQDRRGRTSNPEPGSAEIGRDQISGARTESKLSVLLVPGFFVDRPAFHGRVALLGVSGLIVEQDRHDDAGHSSADVGEIGDAAGIVGPPKSAAPR